MSSCTKPILAASLFCGQAFLGGDANAGPLEFLEAALDNNLDYQQAQLAIPSAEEDLTIASQTRRPQLRGSASYQLPQPKEPGRDKLTAQIVATQEVWNYESAGAVKVAEAAVQLAAHNVDTARQNILLGTYKAYLGAALAKESLAVLKQRKLTLEEQLNIAQSNFELGKATRLQVLNVKAQIASLGAERISAENNLVNALDRLEQLAGIEAGAIASLRHEPMVPDIEVATWVEQVAGSPELLAAAKQVEVAELRITQLKGSIRPSLSLRGTADRRLDTVINLDLTVPIYSSGVATAGLNRAEIALDAAKLSRQSLLDSKALEVRLAHRNLTQLRARIDALQESVAVERERLELALASIELAAGVPADALNASTDLASAELLLIQTRHLLLEVWLEVLAVTGQLTLAKVAQLEGLFV